MKVEYGCIGEHLPHSFSKQIHDWLGLYRYDLKELDRDELRPFMLAREFRGINVTIPYKRDVIEYLDWISPRAEMIGAVNTIINREGRLFGYNTDFGGMEALIHRLGGKLHGRKVVILGTGGTSRTANAVAEHMGASEIIKVSRTGREGAVTYEEACDRHSDARFIINTTPSGMFPDVASTPIDLVGFQRLEGLIDAVYNPLSTVLVRRARSRGVKAEGGLYMLVAQAVIAAELFSGKKLDAGEIDRVFDEILAEKTNIVLTGMPGAGKSTVGRILARRLNRRLIDTDNEILRKTGMSPEVIIREQGETAFRDIESEVIADISALSGGVIATGGGAVLREKNVDALRGNGRLFFLDRDPDTIRPTRSRPLSDNREKLIKVYNERRPIYIGTADVRIASFEGPEETAREIERRLI